jgi:hypothetical protein
MKNHTLERIVQGTSCIAIGLVALQGWLFPAPSNGAQAAGEHTGVESAAAVTAVPAGGGHVRSIEADGTVICRHATHEEMLEMVRRDPTTVSISFVR